MRRILWVVVAGLGAAVFWQAAHSAPAKSDDMDLYRLFVDALEHIDQSYVKEVNRRELVESAINGMLETLDPYSNYIGPADRKTFDRATVGSFGGIGVQIAQKEKSEDYLTVISPLVGTPAYEAGIIAGDRIIKVNGEGLGGLNQGDVVDKLTGPPGSTVAVTVLHKPYKGEPFTVSLTRAKISVESVLGDKHGGDDQWDFMLDPKDKIAYIRVNSFVQKTRDDLEQVLSSLQKQGMRGLILDLRYNPGGLLNAAVEVSDLFLNEGTIVSTKGRNTPDRSYSAKKEGTLPDFPMVVLVNGYSASASEIVAACLQDHHRAVIIGERTWGKGSVQNVIELEGGQSALKLTTASYRRPNGHNIHRFKDSKESDEWGVRPDQGMEIKWSNEEHTKFHQWRMARDRIKGKAAFVKKADDDARKAAEDDAKKQAEESKKKAADKPATEKPAEDKPANDKAAAATEEKTTPADAKATKGAEKKGKGIDDPPAHYEDRQLAKAIEVIRGELAKSSKTAKAQ